MVMKKKLSSEKMVIVSSTDQSEMFPVGYKYLLGSTIYSITDRYKEDNTEMRKAISEFGDAEILTVNSLIKDTKEHNFKLIQASKPEEKTEEEKQAIVAELITEGLKVAKNMVKNAVETDEKLESDTVDSSKEEKTEEENG